MFISLDEKKLTDDTLKVFSDYIESICREIEMREDETMQKILDRIQTPSFVDILCSRNSTWTLKIMDKSVSS